jgi:hypothetical protein
LGIGAVDFGPGQPSEHVLAGVRCQVAI